MASMASLLLAAASLGSAVAQDLSSVCTHENLENVGPAMEITDGETVYRDIKPNQTHRWFYRSYNVTTMNQPDQYRKVIINLEPCRGVVYLFVRKTRRCYPNPYSCIDLTEGNVKKQAANCEWTHFLSEIDGSRDGTPTFFEVPLSSTKYFLSVFSTDNSAYTLTILADIGAFPRPGGNGRITARQLSELQVQISWDEAGFIPPGISDVKQYWIYSSMLLESDDRQNMAVFLRPDKIMNTVCGLQNNTDRQHSIIAATECSNGKCNATIDGVITDKRYVFNVVAESFRGHRMAYAGLIMRTDWEVIRQAASDNTLKVVGAVSGSVLGMVVIIYFLMLKLYG
eukprot:TRINITY_DN108137_c0_g1_i1.p1 TRINITY_DN108137_c0_g1~~TRINITY_DN108137_c0_g1_i1.p1  ORF type:complete len:341 (-),score=68.48 TRINITY_DN108137_c0_g1_i1:41-1063(-)